MANKIVQDTMPTRKKFKSVEEFLVQAIHFLHFAGSLRIELFTLVTQLFHFK